VKERSVARPKAKTLTARSKVWLEIDGVPVFGDGKLRWLELIEETGSLRAAAEALGISYRGLWGRLGEVEKRLGIELVTRRAGGRGGGGAALTPEAQDLVRRYRRFRKGINDTVDRRFQRTFRKK
jgi:molybdate transport system regulatory protein